jgi:hypothetical protein
MNDDVILYQFKTEIEILKLVLITYSEKGQRNITYLCQLITIYEVVSESSRTVIVVTALVKKDERRDQGHTSESLLHQSAT